MLLLKAAAMVGALGAGEMLLSFQPIWAPCQCSLENGPKVTSVVKGKQWGQLALKLTFAEVKENKGECGERYGAVAQNVPLSGHQ